MNAAWPWFTVAGLGLYHGLNPAMGWLFAVALGLHRSSRGAVLGALVPIALGHAVAVAAAAALVAATALVLDPALLRMVAGAALISWALYHFLYGSRHRARVGMQAGFLGLLLWSFLMAGAHGAGLMLAPAVIPICIAGAPAGIAGSATLALIAVLVHTAAMLAVTATIAVVVYEWIGVAFLRRGWINLDLPWTAALAATGVVLLV